MFPMGGSRDIPLNLRGYIRGAPYARNRGTDSKTMAFASKTAPRPSGRGDFGAPDLFGEPDPILPAGVVLRRGLFDPETQAALAMAVGEIARAAPFRRPQTRGAGLFSAAITNCGQVGWWSDRTGYRYTTHQPEGGEPWPALPARLGDAVRRT